MKTELITGTRTGDLQLATNEWDRLPQETKAAYEAFKSYRDQEYGRSLVDVATVLNRRLVTITRWSTRWNWNARCRAFDLHEDEREREEAIRGRANMRKRQIEAGRMMQNIARASLLELQKKVDQKVPLRLTAHEIARLVEVGASLERRALGEDLPEQQFANINVIFGDVDEDRIKARFEQQPRNRAVTTTARIETSSQM